MGGQYFLFLFCTCVEIDLDFGTVYRVISQATCQGNYLYKHYNAYTTLKSVIGAELDQATLEEWD